MLAAVLTEHDFIGGDNDVELEGIRYDTAITVSVVQLILMNQPPAVSTATQSYVITTSLYITRKVSLTFRDTLSHCSHSRN